MNEAERIEEKFKKMCNFYNNTLYIYNMMLYLDNSNYVKETIKLQGLQKYMESRKLYNRIAVLRMEKNISRKELAQSIGVNFQTIGYLEREEYNPSLDLAFKISDYFELPIEFIFSTKPFKPLSEELKELKNNPKGGI